MDTRLDLFTELMFDVYQNFQTKPISNNSNNNSSNSNTNNLELTDYLSSPKGGNFITNMSNFNNNGLISEELINSIVENSNNSSDFVFGGFGDDELVFNFANIDSEQQQQQHQQQLTPINYLLQQLQHIINDDLINQETFQQGQIDNNQLSPQSSTTSTVDLNSIFSYNLDFTSTLADTELITTRNNSISSLSSGSSTLVKTPIEHYSSTFKIHNSRRSPLTTNSSFVSVLLTPSSSSIELNNNPKRLQSRSTVGNNNNNGKRHSDSRLSLNELSTYLNLDNNITETAKREQEILTIFKDELGFELGLKTWVRDTSSSKRQQLVSDLTQIVESRYHYGYSERLIEVIIRRASYYTMQGRLRRERRTEQKARGEKIDKNRRHTRV